MLKFIAVLGIVKKFVGFLARVIKRIATAVFRLIKKFFRRFWQEVKRAPLLFAVIGVLVMGIFGYAIHAHCEQSQKAEEEQQSEAVITEVFVDRGLEVIGELNTAEYTYCDTQTLSNSRQLFNWDVPLTEKNLYVTYDGVVKAGYDLDELDYYILGNAIIFDLPKAKITNHSVGGGYVQLEQNNIFNPITSNDYATLRNNAVNNGLSMAEEQGIYEKAEEELKQRLKAFFGDHGCVVLFK